MDVSSGLILKGQNVSNKQIKLVASILKGHKDTDCSALAADLLGLFSKGMGGEFAPLAVSNRVPVKLVDKLRGSNITINKACIVALETIFERTLGLVGHLSPFCSSLFLLF